MHRCTQADTNPVQNRDQLHTYPCNINCTSTCTSTYAQVPRYLNTHVTHIMHNHSFPITHLPYHQLKLPHRLPIPRSPPSLAHALSTTIVHPITVKLRRTHTNSAAVTTSGEAEPDANKLDLELSYKPHGMHEMGLQTKNFE